MGTNERSAGPARLRVLAEGAEDRSARLADGLADAAWADGRLDVAYGFADSPFGPLLVAVTRRGLIRVLYPDYDVDEQVDAWPTGLAPRAAFGARHAGRPARARRVLRRAPAEAFDVPAGPSLAPRVPSVGARADRRASRIGIGDHVREMAERAGSPRAARATGNALGSNPVPIVVPCHRVVHSDGGLGGYTGGLDAQGPPAAAGGRARA